MSQYISFRLDVKQGGTEKELASHACGVLRGILLPVSTPTAPSPFLISNRSRYKGHRFDDFNLYNKHQNSNPLTHPHDEQHCITEDKRQAGLIDAIPGDMLAQLLGAIAATLIVYGSVSPGLCSFFAPKH